ncbi:MAG: hypothetical protein ACJAR7_001525, partial [Polaromonas sp.]
MSLALILKGFEKLLHVNKNSSNRHSVDTCGEHNL